MPAAEMFEPGRDTLGFEVRPLLGSTLDELENAYGYRFERGDTGGPVLRVTATEYSGGGGLKMRVSLELYAGDVNKISFSVRSIRITSRCGRPTAARETTRSASNRTSEIN